MFWPHRVERKRLLSLVAQKFVSDIAADAFQHARLRTNATGGSRVKTDKSGQGGSSTTVKVSARRATSSRQAAEASLLSLGQEQNSAYTG